MLITYNASGMRRFSVHIRGKWRRRDDEKHNLNGSQWFMFNFGWQTNKYTHTLAYEVCMSKQRNKTTSNSNLNYKKSQNETLDLRTNIKDLRESESKDRLSQEPVKLQ